MRRAVSRAQRQRPIISDGQACIFATPSRMREAAEECARRKRNTDRMTLG